MKGDIDEEGWTYVKGSRTPPQLNVNIHRSHTVDELVCRSESEEIKNAVAHVLREGKEFLKPIIKKIRKHVLRCSGIRIVALGLGSPTALSMPLTRSFRYQFASCLIVREVFRVEAVDVFDPIMDVNDIEICRSLLEDWHPDVKCILRYMKDPSWVLEEDDDTTESHGNATCVLLWMPHCEAELYKKVLVDVYAGEDPLNSARALARVEPSPSTMRYDLSNTILVGNSLKHYQGEKSIPQHILDRVVEAALPDFTPFYRAFSDSYVTEFRTLC